MSIEYLLTRYLDVYRAPVSDKWAVRMSPTPQYNLNNQNSQRINTQVFFFMDEGSLFLEINKSKTFKLDKDHITSILLNQWLVGGECWWVYTPVQICHVPFIDNPWKELSYHLEASSKST